MAMTKQLTVTVKYGAQTSVEIIIKLNQLKSQIAQETRI